MPLFSAISRRLILGAAGGLAVSSVSGGGAAAARGRQNAGVIPSREAAAPMPEAFGPQLKMDLGSIEFVPVDSTTYQYVSPGGVKIAAGGVATYFNCPVNLPVGAQVLSVIVFINPDGNDTSITFTRYRPISPTFQVLGSATSSSGNASEAVKLTVNSVIQENWNYRIDNCQLQPDNQIIYGARVTYRLPV